MADEIIIETTSAEVIEVGVPGPQGPAGAAGTGLETLTTQGDTLYRGAATGERLPIGTTGQILRVSASGIPEWGAAPASGVSSVNGESGAIVLDGSDIDTSGNDVSAAFTMSTFEDGDGIYYPLPDQFINTKPIYRTTSGYSVYFESLRWHITDGAPITANIVESSDDDSAAWPWLSAWSGDVDKAKLADVVGRARDTFLFVGDSIPNTSVSGLASVAASGDYDDLTGKPTLGNSAALDVGTTTGTVAAGDDARLSDSRTPTAHAASHAAAGSDPVFDQDLNTTDDVAFNSFTVGDIGVGSGTLTWAGDDVFSLEDGTFFKTAIFDDGIVLDGDISFIGDNAATNAATTRDNLGLGDAATADIGTGAGDVCAGDDSRLSDARTPTSHAHGNITNDGKVGSTSGLPLVTTTAGAVTTLALGTAGQVLTVNSGANGVEFAAASGGGVTAVGTTLADILSVSGSDLVADDLGSDKLYGWDDSASKAIGFTIGSGLSVSGDTLSATATGTIGGSTGSTDNVILRSNGTGGSTLQESGLIVSDVVRTFTGVTGDAAADTITITGSGFGSGQRVRFTSLTGGSGLNTTTNYFVVNPSGDTFQVSTTLGGSPSLFTTNITAGTLINAHVTWPHVALSQNTPETDSAAVVGVKGNGAFTLSSAGNVRGTQACDLQIGRVIDTQVASGTRAFIAGGQRSTASGTESFCANYEGTSSGSYSFACNESSTASGSGTFATGQITTASGSYAASFGIRSLANRTAVQAYASGMFAAAGDAQRVRAVLRNKTTTNTAVELFMGTDTNVRLTVPSGKVMAMLINITGVKSDGSAVAHYVRQYAIKNVGGTTSEVYAAATIGTDNAASTSITLSANDTNDALKIEVTGIASETWRWVASVDAVEVAYGT